jgi:hypothetical protein
MRPTPSSNGNGRWTFGRPYRATPVRVFNWVGSTLRGFGWRNHLTIEGVLRQARESTGLSDWGDESFLEPLGLLVESFETNARLTPMGRLMIDRLLTHFVGNRLRMQREVESHPEILDERIERPLFIVGLPRTGTSLLNGLLSADPRCRALLTWEGLWPTPLSPAGRKRPDIRPRKTKRLLRGVDYLVPHLRAVHPMKHDAPEETTLLMANTFVAWTFSMMGHVRDYDDWLWSVGRAESDRAYEYLKLQLQALQWQRPGGRWLLKSPVHLHSLDSLMRTFPDALVIQTHRDPVQSVPSTCSLFAILRSLYSDSIDPRTLGEEMCQRLARAVIYADLARAAAPERMIDLRYDDLVADKIGTVRRLYEQSGREYDGATERAMRRWLDRNPHRGGHRYDLEQFGLTTQEIDRLFGNYCEAFDLRAGPMSG